MSLMGLNVPGTMQPKIVLFIIYYLLLVLSCLVCAFDLPSMSWKTPTDFIFPQTKQKGRVVLILNNILRIYEASFSYNYLP